MKHYTSSEWHFALDIPSRWHNMPPVSTNSPNEVMRFASMENGTHLLIVFREIHNPKQTLAEVSDRVQQMLAGKGFNNFVSAETMIGSRIARTLDFDRQQDGGIWSCRHYFIAHDTLRYTLGFGTTMKSEMFELYGRMAKSFEFSGE
jgi:hypothetical protein